MPSAAKKRAKLKKQQQQQQQQNPNPLTHSSDARDNGSDHHLPIPPTIPHVDVSEDSMESSEEVPTPKAVAEAVPVERAVEAVQEVAGGGGGVVVSEVVVLAAPQPAVEQPESEPVVAKAEQPQPVQESASAEQPQPVQESASAEQPQPVQEPAFDEQPAVQESASDEQPPVQEAASNEPSRSAEASPAAEDAPSPEGAAGGPVLVARRAAWWDCCGILGAFTGSRS